MDHKKKKTKSVSALALLIPFFIGGVFGVLGGVFLSKFVPDNASFIEMGGIFLLFVCFVFAVVFSSVILHEAGHLLFGLLSGYSFCSFMIFGIDFIKQDGKIRIKRYSLPGAGGQCLMNPPDFNGNEFPVVLYNLGGIIINLLLALVCGALFLFLELGELVQLLILAFALINLAFALVNGIPLRAVLENDGYNTLMLKNNPRAREAFWLQLKIHENLAQGARIKDLPSEWFSLPTDEELAKNSIISYFANASCERLFDERKFDEAYKLCDEFLNKENKINVLNRVLMVADMVFIELVGENRQEVVQKLLTKDRLKLMAQLKKIPCILKTEYAYALLYLKDEAKAQRIKNSFQKIKDSYPYAGEIEAAEELFALADSVKSKRDAQVSEN